MPAIRRARRGGSGADPDRKSSQKRAATSKKMRTSEHFSVASVRSIEHIDHVAGNEADGKNEKRT